MDDEERQSANDGDGTEVAHQHTVGGDELLVSAVAEASDDANSDGIENGHESRADDVHQIV